MSCIVHLSRALPVTFAAFVMLWYNIVALNVIYHARKKYFKERRKKRIARLLSDVTDISASALEKT